MPLFPSLGRSKNRTPQHHHYNDPYTMEYEDSHPTRTPSWSNVLPGRNKEQGGWEEEFVDYPSRPGSYAPPPGSYFPPTGSYVPPPGSYAPTPGPSRQRSLGPAGAEFPAQRSAAPSTITEETHDELYSDFRSDSPIPVVRRENSANHIADPYDRHASRVTEVPIPSQRFSSTDIPTPTEIHNIYPGPQRQQPVVVNQSVIGSMHPDVVQGDHYRERTRGRHEANRRDYAQSSSSDSQSGLRPEEYPPCVVVIEKGRRGKKDTYYIIPGGAPVIFKDEDGYEITRVGDFSGRYKPQPPRPVIIEDTHGREIYRMGFNDNTIMGNSEDRYHGSRRSNRDDDRYHERQYSSAGHRHENSDHDSDYHRGRDGYRSPRSREPDIPNVVFVDPSNSSRTESPPNNSRRSHRRTSPQRYYESPRPQTSPVIHLDQFRRQSSRTGSPRTSGRSHHRR